MPSHPTPSQPVDSHSAHPDFTHPFGLWQGLPGALSHPATNWADLHSQQLQLLAQSQRVMLGAAHSVLQQQTQFTLNLLLGWSHLACAGLGAGGDAERVERSLSSALRGLSTCADALGKAQQQWIGQVQEEVEEQAEQIGQALHDVESAALMPAPCKGEVGL